MKIALINGSPKQKNSASRGLLCDLRAALPAGTKPVEAELHGPTVPPEIIPTLDGCGAWVLAFPLYVDGVPGHLLSCLTQLEKTAKGKSIYAVVNCGFYEGAQTGPALEIMENFCAKSGARWGGVGTGGGGALGVLPGGEKGPKALICRALTGLAETAAEGKIQENKFVTVAFPRTLYKLSGQMGWRKQIKDNGGKPRDLGRRF